MKIIVRISIVLFLILSVFGQELPTIKPTLGRSNTYSKADQVYLQKLIDKNFIPELCFDNGCGNKEHVKEYFEKGYYKEKCVNKSFEECCNEVCPKEICNERNSVSFPITETFWGCTWYGCGGGGPSKTTVSSSIKDQGKITYAAENAHDFNLFTAWIPQNKNGALKRSEYKYIKNNAHGRYIITSSSSMQEGGAIGEKINFYFSPMSKESVGMWITDIFIYNGYIKNSELWNEHSRVAKFKLFIDGKPIAILELEDVNNCQKLQIDKNLVDTRGKSKDIVLTLEIFEIYMGTKLDDVAISEINFGGGTTAHCFAAGTQITMADNTTKNIELIAKNDKVMAFDQKTKKLFSAQVSNLVEAQHSNIVKLSFSDREITATDDHPFWIKDGVWASINPDKSNKIYEQKTKTKKLDIGSKVFVPSENKYIDLVKIEKIEEEQTTYTIELTESNNFIANGILVKTEKLKVKK